MKYQVGETFTHKLRPDVFFNFVLERIDNNNYFLSYNGKNYEAKHGCVFSEYKMDTLLIRSEIEDFELEFSV